jgi:urease accessory protein
MWVLPVVFPMVMALGGMLGLMGVKLPGIELCIALSALALGFAVCREARPKLWIAGIIVGFFAIAHGHAMARNCLWVPAVCFIVSVLR